MTGLVARMLLLMAVLALSAGIASHAFRLLDARLPPAVASRSPDLGAGPQPRQISKLEPQKPTGFSEVLARPVFFEGRRIPILTPEPVQPAPPPLPPPPEPVQTLAERLRLIGIMIDGEVRRALIESGEGAAVWVTMGESLNGWLLTNVTEVGVTLTTRGRTATLDLYERNQAH